MKNVSQSYWEYIYNGTVSYDDEFAYEYNKEWKEEVRRMRESKNIKQQEREK